MLGLFSLVIYRQAKAGQKAAIFTESISRVSMSTVRVAAGMDSSHACGASSSQARTIIDLELV